MIFCVCKLFKKFRFLLLEFWLLLEFVSISKVTQRYEPEGANECLFRAIKHANLNECKKTKFKHCHVGLLEITPSISEKPACSRTEEEMINKIIKRGKRLEKDKKLQYRWSMLRNSQISCGK